LKIREPLLKHIKTEVPMVQNFVIFPPFNRDAPVPVQQVYSSIFSKKIFKILFSHHNQNLLNQSQLFKKKERPKNLLSQVVAQVVCLKRESTHHWCY